MKDNRKTRNYWARCKIANEWGMWHLIPAKSEALAHGKMQDGTRLLYDEVETTDKEPSVYAGKAAKS